MNASDLECNIVANVQKKRSRLLNYFWKICSFFGLPYFWILLGIIFLFLGNSTIPILYLVLAISYGIIVVPLKLLIKRLRPSQKCDNVDSLTSKTKYSFPSGHTFIATSFGLVIGFYYEEIIWVIAMLFFGIIVGISRIYLGAHFLSDVFFSYIIAILVVSCIFYVVFPLMSRCNLLFKIIIFCLSFFIYLKTFGSTMLV